MTKLRNRIGYADVIATLALFLALTGVGYAAGRIHGSQIENRSIKGVKLKRNAVTGREIRESTLRQVPRARRARAAANAANADKLNGLTAAQLRVRCEDDLAPEVAVCFEQMARSAQVYKLAVLTCALDGRRLPTHNELLAFLSRDNVQVAAGGELTSNVVEPRAPSATRTVDVAVMTDDTGSTEFVNAGGTESPRPFRCVEPMAD